jgi:hypothetical protein
VGSIACQTNPSAETRSNGQLSIAPPTPLLIPSEIVEDIPGMKKVVVLGTPSRPSLRVRSIPSRTQEVTTDAGDSTDVRKARRVRWWDEVPKQGDLPNAGSNSTHNSTQQSEVSNA